MSKENTPAPEPFKRYYNVEVIGQIGRIVFSSVPMSYAECKYFWDQGIQVPIELWPREVWWKDGLPIFGEENLGNEF